MKRDEKRFEGCAERETIRRKVGESSKVRERERETPEEQWKDIVASRCVGASEWNDGSLP